MHWVVFWVLHVSNIRYSKVLSVLKTIHTFYIPEKMHVQSKVTRFLCPTMISPWLVAVCRTDQVTNRRSKPWRQCCWLLLLSTSLKSVPSSAIRKLVFIVGTGPLSFKDDFLWGFWEFRNFLPTLTVKGWLVGIQGWDWCDVVMIWLGCLEILWSEKALFFLKNSCDRYGLFFLLCLIFSSILTLTSTV